MRIIFLDIDGVLKPWNTNFLREEEPWTAFDKQACFLMEELAVQTRAKFVISSNWRNEFETAEEMAKILGRMGFLLLRPDWRTDNLGPRRGDEIQRWLHAHVDIESYVIIDDNVLSDFPVHQHPRFIQTETKSGFLHAHFDRAMHLLMNEES